MTGTISVPVSKTLTIPAGSTSWYQTNDQKSILGWTGALQAPDKCAGGVMHNTDGATFDVNVTAGAHSGQLSFQFHYRVPVAEGKANTDCTNANDPEPHHRLPGEVERHGEHLIEVRIHRRARGPVLPALSRR